MPQPRDLPPSLSDEARDAIKGYQDIDRQRDDDAYFSQSPPSSETHVQLPGLYPEDLKKVWPGEGTSVYDDLVKLYAERGLLIVRNPEGPGYLAFIEKDKVEPQPMSNDMGRVAIGDVETFRLPHSQGDGHDAEA